LFGKWLSKKRCSSLSSWPDGIASSSIRPITNAQDVSKSAVGFIELPQTHRTASTSMTVAKPFQWLFIGSRQKSLVSCLRFGVGAGLRPREAGETPT
jgi:hypothetical protein